MSGVIQNGRHVPFGLDVGCKQCQSHLIYKFKLQIVYFYVQLEKVIDNNNCKVDPEKLISLYLSLSFNGIFIDSCSSLWSENHYVCHANEFELYMVLRRKIIATNVR
jgi:hypothetical protein